MAVLRKAQETMVGDESAILALRDVEAYFPGQGKPALSGITIDIFDGEFVTVVGPSGCGKTTLLRVVHGLIPTSRGEVTVAGSVVRGPSRDRGFVFQSDCLLPWRTVIDNIGYPLELHGTPRRQAREEARRLLKMTGLAESASKFPGQLSGGMRQRVNLARALAIDPRILLMDEPFAALDAQTREIMQAELQSIWQQRKKTVLFVTHQLDEAVYLADRVVVLAPNPGQVKEIVPIDLPRPRTLDLKHTDQFNEKVEVLWNLIKTDLLQQQHAG